MLNDLVIDPPHKEGQGTPVTFVPQHPGAFDVEDFVRGAMHDVWNWRLLNKLPDYYARTCPLHAPRAANSTASAVFARS